MSSTGAAREMPEALRYAYSSLTTEWAPFKALPCFLRSYNELVTLGLAERRYVGGDTYSREFRRPSNHQKHK